MSVKTIVRITLMLVLSTTFIFSYISLQNTVTRLKIQIPKIEKQLHAINTEVAHLQYEIDQFESPDRLMDFAYHPDFSHLKHPYIRDIETVPEGVALTLKQQIDVNSNMIPSSIGSR